MTVAVSTKQEQADKVLPKGWKWKQIKDVCTRIDYGFTASADFAVKEPKFLRITDIQDGQVCWENVPGCQISPDKEQANRLTDRDIVFARTGGTTGKSFLIKDPPDRAVFASYLIRLRLTNDALPDYIYSFLQSDHYWQQVRASARGGAQPNVNASLLGDIKFPLPPFEEQRRIVAILNKKMEAIATARKATLAQIEAAEALPAAYLRQVFESPEAQQWERKKLADIAKTCSGSTPSRKNKDYYIGTIPWVKTGELLDGKIIKAEEHISETALRETSVKLLPPNTLLIAMYGQGKPRGRTGLLTIPATTNQACFAILPNDQYFTSEYLQFWFRYNYYRLREMTEGRGGNQPNLNDQLLRDLVINLPTLEKQKNITTQLNKSKEETKRIIRSLQKQLKAINALPAAILRQAFNGEL